LKQAGLSINDIGLIELKLCLAVKLSENRIKSGYRERKWCNRYGTPTGMYWAKLSVQLFDEMKRRGDKYGIVTMWEQVIVQEFMN
jgi:acetyl-CoA acyltransferase